MLPQNVSALSRLCDLNPTLPITALPFAIGATDGKVGFKVMPDNSMGKLNTSGFQAEAAAKSEFLVEMRALDSLIFGSDRYPHPDVLKIDVEGAELDVLTGAKRALQESMPVLFIETHSRALDEQCRNFLTGIGYVLTPLREPTASEPTGHLMAAAPLRP
jgi:FkbM family methyltransferase